MATQILQDTADVKTEKVVYVDPFATVEAGEVRKLNPDANPDDAWGTGAPPPKGFYDLRLMPLGKETVQKKWIDKDDTNKGFYYQANVELQVVSDVKETNGASVYTTVSTMLYRGKELSTMAALIRKAGFEPIPKGQAEIADGALVTRFAKVCQKQPVIKDVLVNWQASYQDDAKKYINVLTDYDQFPDDMKGGKEHEVLITLPNKSQMTVKARAQIQWNVKKDGMVSQPKKATQTITPEAQAPVAPKKAVTVTIDSLDDL